MRSYLLLTHWGLLFVTLISSCFLFYVVASENAKYVIKKHLKDASMASNIHKHRTLTSSSSATILTTGSTRTTLQTVSDVISSSSAFAGGDQLKSENNIVSSEKINNNKRITRPDILQQVNSDIAPSSEFNVLSSSPLVSDGVEESVTSDDLKSSGSDSVLIDNSNIIAVENKNAFNIIEKNTNENVNYEIHSSIESETPIIESQQVPDVNKQAKREIVQKHVHDYNADITNGLPDITDIPTVTVTDSPLKVLQQPQNTLDSVIIADGNDRSSEEQVNGTIDVIADSKEEIQKDKQIVKINDSGGGDERDIMQSTITVPINIAENQEAPSLTNNIPIETSDMKNIQPIINSSIEQQQQQPQSANLSNSARQVNLTAAEEVPMPVFSEWAQKQMEAAEKQQALEQEQSVNNSAQRKNNTNGNGKPATLKLRTKNYASPDCGAKIIASSAYTSNAGAVLSSSKDEYMLSLCGNRIWFVVELCEAIQAQKIDFANFELYSSSPQNFTVAVSKRFPTREWSNVGRFVADDKRAVQSFDLHPHLFGKFVRVDINSHYSKEHFCTLSLFRVFGTSEFEAFETENHPNEDLDDFDDEYLLEQNTVKHAESNLFKSASDAVLSIVKKATEVLGKPSNNQNQTFKTQPQTVVCRTPIYGLFSCSECPSSLVEKVNNVLTCEFSQLNVLLNNKVIRKDLLNTRVCAKLYGIETRQILTPLKDIKQSFFVNILPNEYVAALCQLLAMPKDVEEKPNSSLSQNEAQNDATEIPSNLTIDKKIYKGNLNLDHTEKKLMKSEVPNLNVEPTKFVEDIIETSTETNLDDNLQLPRPLEPGDVLETTTLPSNNIIQKPTLPDTNIFNVPADDLPSETEIPVTATDTATSNESVEQFATIAQPTTIPTSTPAANIETTTAAPIRNEEDTNSWDNIEQFLTTVPSTIVASNSGNTGNSAQYNQQKNSNSGPQSESVFIRLSNRIKALERNMSLSGQYLEELSRRYKKQVEELQQTLTQQIQTVRTLEEQNRRHHELGQLYALQNIQLKDELDDLTLQVHACIVVIIFVGAFVFLVLMVGILFYRSLKRETKTVLALYEKNVKKRNETSTVVGNTQKKINRRKSFEDFSDHQQCIKKHEQDNSNVSNSYGENFRRSSEEAMLILEECKENKKTEELGKSACVPSNSTVTRQRKISVCYDSNNITDQSLDNTILPPIPPQKITSKRKGEKHSWPNSAHAQMQARQHLEQLNNEDHIGDSQEISSTKVKKSFAVNCKPKKKKDLQTLKRQQSSPVECLEQFKSCAQADLKSTEFDEGPLLDEDDLDNFIPNNDLAYNEFMPDGPRGYQCLSPNASANNSGSKKLSNKQMENVKKSRRLSSPVFFKSPFTKSFKGKISNDKSNPAHESTSWEWYRSKKSTSFASSNGGYQNMMTTTISNSANNAFLRVSPNTSMDSSSLSEINFPTNSTANSFRILEEAILSSGESAITPKTTDSSNCKKSTGGISSSSNSNRSSSSNSSTQSKKKNRSFNKIFRKVF